MPTGKTWYTPTTKEMSVEGQADTGYDMGKLFDALTQRRVEPQRFRRAPRRPLRTEEGKRGTVSGPPKWNKWGGAIPLQQGAPNMGMAQLVDWERVASLGPAAAQAAKAYEASRFGDY